MNIKEGKYTIKTFAKKQNLTRQSAINLLSRLKKQGYVQTQGGGKQKRIYTITKTKKTKTNGFYDTVNKYSPQKLNPIFEHYVQGKYPIERAILDGLKIGDIRTLEATMYLFKHIKDWRSLLYLAKKNNLKKELINLYKKARKTTKCKKMPKRYLK